MTRKTVAVVDYGSGNLRSVSQAMAHVAPGSGLEVVVTADPQVVLDAERVLLLGPPSLPDHLARADIYQLLDCPQGERFDLERALLLCDDPAQRLHLSQRLRQLSASPALH